MPDTFTGTTSGNFTTVGNWSTGNVPGTGASETANIAGSTRSILSGLDRSAANALTLCEVHDTMLGSVGAGKDDPLIIDAATLIVDGRGDSYSFKGDYSSVYVLGTAAQSVSLNDGGGGSETIGNVWIQGPAETTIEASAEFDVLRVSRLAGAVAIGASATGTSMEINGGHVTSEASITAEINAGGRLTLDGAGAGTITVNNGGVLELLTSATSGLTIHLKDGGELVTKNNDNIPEIATLNEHFGSRHDIDELPQRTTIGTRNRVGFPADVT